MLVLSNDGEYILRNLIFIGGGGYFLELFEYIDNDIKKGQLKGVRIKGVIDDKHLDGLTFSTYLSTVDSYEIVEGDVFIISIGNPYIRERIFSKFKSRGAKFITYIHPTSIIAPSAKIGEGCIICPYSIVNSLSSIGENVSLNVHSSIGHEAKIGSNSVISPYVALNGCSEVGRQAFLGTRCTIFPGVTLGDKVVVDSHTAVRDCYKEQMLLTDRGNFVAVKNRMIR